MRRNLLILALILGTNAPALAIDPPYEPQMERLARNPEALAAARAAATHGGEAYLDAVVKETLRSRPVIPVSYRWRTKRAASVKPRLRSTSARRWRRLASAC